MSNSFFLREDFSPQKEKEKFGLLREDFFSFAKENQNNQLFFDVFLSYSYSDKDIAITIASLFEKIGLTVYIDLRDDEIKDRTIIDELTAKRICTQLARSKTLVFISSESADKSYWCPWEIGYFTAKNGMKCAIFPIMNHKESLIPHHEFLALYPYITYSVNVMNLRVEMGGLGSTSISFSEWINQ
jgi:hypothetical protein